MKVIADITNAIAGTERQLLASIEQVWNTNPIEVIIVCKPIHQVSVSAYSPQNVRVLPDRSHHSQIAGYIQREFIEPAGALDHSAQCTIISFHPAVLALASYVPTRDRGRFVFVHWMRLRGQAVTGSKAVAAEALKNLLSEADVLAAVEAGLRAANAFNAASGVRMSDLRPYLEMHEPRLRKNHPGANVSGIIGAAMEIAERRGLVTIDRAVHPINSLVWLTASVQDQHLAPVDVAYKTKYDPTVASEPAGVAMIPQSSSLAGSAPSLTIAKPPKEKRFFTEFRGRLGGS